MSSPSVAEQLVRGGRELISREGVGDLSVRRLVEAAGRSTMCVYSHFGNRKRLLAEVYRSCADDLLTGLAKGRTADDLERDYAAYADREPRHFQYLFAADLAGFGIDEALRLDLIEAVAALAASRLDASPSEALAWWLRVHGAVWLDTVQRLAGEPDRFDTAAVRNAP
jgi:AcrR family transcriptional regulator